MAARTTAVVSFAIFFIFGVGCSWRGAVANGGSWGGCVDNGSSCGVVLKLSNRFFGALAGARFFFGFRPRLLGIGKQWIGTDQIGRSPKTILRQAACRCPPLSYQDVHRRRANQTPDPDAAAVAVGQRALCTALASCHLLTASRMHRKGARPLPAAP
jgi:hypothetical protein